MESKTLNNDYANKKIREYHKKYYRPDNCLFYYEGTAALEDVLLQLNKFIPDLFTILYSSKATKAWQNL